MTLRRLLTRAHVPRYQRERWFSGAQYVNDQIVTSDEKAAGVIERCYLSKLRQFAMVSRVTVVDAPEPVKATVSAFKKAYRGEAIGPKTGGLF